jgi:hypothetical protein
MGDKPIQDFCLDDVCAFRDARRAWMGEKERQRKEREEKLKAGDMMAARAIVVSPELPGKRSGEIGINRHLEVLRQVFTFAIEQGYFKGDNPFHKFGLRKKPKGLFAKEKSRRRLLQGDRRRDCSSTRTRISKRSSLRLSTWAVERKNYCHCNGARSATTGAVARQTSNWRTSRRTMPRGNRFA